MDDVMEGVTEGITESVVSIIDSLQGMTWTRCICSLPRIQRLDGRDHSERASICQGCPASQAL